MGTNDQFERIEHHIQIHYLDRAVHGTVEFGRLLIPENRPRQNPRREAVRRVAVELA
ncbi:hypothetical protein Sar04_45180 [Salinispora arenicola]|uniref:Uncharacterized protein n=1 Tax=Salinispora arenicola TaxID=168697 RepID=A0ABQ4K0J8_SALAC|nr:hypothetical protein Sar04_45180 [Salinispora arenicola]